MDILLCIDGTGDSSDSVYNRTMAHSHVRKIWYHSPLDDTSKRYMRGPTLLGLEMDSIVARGYSFVHDRYRELDPGRDRALDLEAWRPRVLLAGYSRGAAAIVDLARQLYQYAEIDVAAMVLFDCVDRAIDLESENIPANVRWLIHAMRDDAASSRESFGHSGVRITGPTIQAPGSPRRFFGTHGAIGGAYATTQGSTAAYVDERGIDGMTNVSYARDRECADEVWAWVRPHLREQGFIR